MDGSTTSTIQCSQPTTAQRDMQSSNHEARHSRHMRNVGSDSLTKNLPDGLAVMRLTLSLLVLGAMSLVVTEHPPVGVCPRR